MKRSLLIMTLIAGSNLNGFQKKTLDNGLLSVVHQKKKLPIFAVVLGFKTGSAYDPEGKEGLANLVGNLLDKGTPKRNAFEIQEELSDIGASLRISTSYTYTTLNLTVLTEKANDALSLLKDIAFSPTFQEEEIQREIKRIKTEILQNRSNPNYVTAEIFRSYLYEGHPLSHFPEGNPAHLTDLTREEITKFYRRFYVPKNAILTIVSSQEEARVLKMVQEIFSDIPSVETKIPEVPSVKPLPEGVNVKIVPRPVNQSVVVMGHFGPMRSSEDYNSARAMNYVLGGGGFASRLFEEIRNKKGYAYSVYSYFEPQDPFKGRFIFGFQTKLESTNDALKALIDEIKKLRQEGVKEKELEDTKGYFQGYIPRNTETYTELARNFFYQEFYGLEPFFWEKDVKEIMNLTVSELNQSANKYLDPENLLIVILTDTSKFKLEGIEPTSVFYEENK